MESNEYLGMGEKIYQPEADNDYYYHGISSDPSSSFMSRRASMIDTYSIIARRFSRPHWLQGLGHPASQRPPHLLTEGRCGVSGVVTLRLERALIGLRLGT